MAKTIALYNGGTPILTFPAHDSTRIFGIPFPKQVAGEYNRGYFTLGNILQPAAIPFQRDALLRVRKPGDYPVSIPLLIVPELHTFTQLYLHTLPMAPVDVDCCGLRGDTMQGVTFDVVAKLLDASKASDYDSLEEFLDSGEDYALPDGFTGIDANTEVVVHKFVPAEDAAFIPQGKTLLIGLKILTAPTGVDGMLSKMAGRIALTAKVENFEYPNHN